MNRRNFLRAATGCAVAGAAVPSPVSPQDFDAIYQWWQEVRLALPGDAVISIASTRMSDADVLKMLGTRS